MSLAQINCSEVSAIDTSHKNTILRFENRIKCLNSMFWNIHQAISNQEKTILVLDRKEDLEYINYFLSKYHIKPLSLIINPKQEHLSPIIINNLNAEQEFLSEAQDLNEIENSIEGLIRGISKHLTQIRTPKLGQLNILDIYNRSKITQLQNAPMNIDLFQLVPFEQFKEKKYLIKRASELFKNQFKFIEQNNVLKGEFILNMSIENIKSVFRDFSDELASLNTDLENIYAQIENDISHDSIKNSTELQNILFEITKYKKQAKLKDTEKKKVTFFIEKFQKKSGFSLIQSSKIEELISQCEEAFKVYILNLNKNKKAHCQYTLQRINKFNGGDKALSIFKKVDAISSKVEQSHAFVEWVSPKPCSLLACIEFCNALNLKIESAEYFIETSEEYIHWLYFVNSINPCDQSIIQSFINIKSDWVEVFESNYLDGFVNAELMQISNIETEQGTLMDKLKDYEGSFAASIHNKYKEKKNSNVLPVVASDATKIFWNHFLAEQSDKMFDKFPLIILDPMSFEKHAALFEEKIDKTIFLNRIPEKLPNKTTVKNIISGYTSSFNNNVVKFAKSLEDVELKNFKGTDFNINRSMKNMNLSEINMLALYLGKTIHDINPNYKIFQLKSKAIISFLKDDKNAELLQIIGQHGAKEIFSREDDYNLLPGVISDPHSNAVILLEDNFIGQTPNDFNIRQMVLLDKIKTSGIKVISINNYKLLTDKNYNIENIIGKLIASANPNKETVKV